MDQYLSAVVVTVITGVFSLITLLVQKRQDKVINKIDEQTKVIKKEKELKQRLSTYEKERQALINTIMILILDTNLAVMQATDNGSSQVAEAMKVSEELKSKFNELSEKIEDVNHEYNMILEIKSETQQQ